MKVTMISNFLNHHQIPFCDEMYGMLGDDFRFVATERIDPERLELGYRDHGHSHPYSINSYENERLFHEAMELSYRSDLVITGSAPELFIKRRLRENKLTFRYSERLFKQGLYRIMDPRIIFAVLFHHTIFRRKNLHMLCSSAYTSFDFSLFFAYPGKYWKWGYFSEVREYDLKNLLSLKPAKKMNILWAGRFLSWKHPEYMIQLARMLVDKKYDFSIQMIGSGERLERTKNLVEREGLGRVVSFPGPMSPERVRHSMEQSNIFIITSDRREGWGVVLNEAMNSGCAVLTNSAPGAVPFLLEDGKNGLLYKAGDINNLCDKVESLINNPGLCRSLGENAYHYMVTGWTPRLAAERLIRLGRSILEGNPVQFASGPCSQAEIIRE